MKKNYIGKALVIIFALLVTSFVFIWIRTIAYNNGVAKDIGIADDNHSVIEVADGMVLNQEFVNDASTIRSVLLKFNISSSLKQGSVKTELVDVATDETIGSCTQPYENIADNNYTIFDMGSITGDIKDKALILRVTIQGIQPGELVMFAENQEQFCARIVPVGRDNFCILIDVAFVFLIIVIVASMCWILFGKNLKVENVFLFLAITLGFLMTLLIPTMSVPDEQFHMHAAYRLSNEMLGIEAEQEGYLMMRYSDDKANLMNEGLGRWYYNWYYDRAFEDIENPEVVHTGNYETYNTPYLYVVPAVGLTIGRLLGLNTIPTYLIGKWMNLLLFSFAVYYAIKRMPFAKTMVAVWALFPIMMQQVGSYSYDCGIYSLTVLVIALTINFMYGEGYESKKIRYIDMGLLALCAILLAPCKSFGIIPIAVLPLMLLAKYLWGRRDRIKTYFIEKKYRIVVLGAILALMLAIVAVVMLKVYNILLAGADGQGHYLTYLDQYAYPAGYYLKNPMDFILKIWTTLWIWGDRYLGQMVGSNLGWLEIEVPLVFVLPFLLMFMLAGVRKHDEEQCIGVVSKLWMVAMFMGVCVIACVGMLLYWTPMSSIAIIGIQGRYFLPGLILIGLSLRTNKISVSGEIDKGILCAIPVLYTFVVGAVFYNMI